MGVLRRQYEREKARQAKKDDKPRESSSSNNGNYGPLYVLGFAFLVVMFFALMANFTPGGPRLVLPSMDLSVQATSLAGQQSVLEQSMTVASGATAAVYQAQQTAVQAQQDALSTQVAQVTATQAVQATATAFSFTQTPLAATQISMGNRIEQERREAYWKQYTTPMWILGGGALALAIGIIGTILGVITFFKLLPVYAAKLRVVKEDRGERTIYLGEKGITRPDLMHQPTITEQPDGTMLGSGGAEDPYLQAQIAASAANVKAVQALPGGIKLPGQAPKAADKVLPQLEVVDGQVIEPKLLKDVRESLDREEGTA